MAEDRSQQYLKIIKDGKVVNVGEKGTKKAAITGEPANTKIPKGKYKTVYDNTADKALSGTASPAMDVGEVTTSPINVTGVTLDQTALTVETGKTTQLKASVAPANATNKTVTWKSGNNATATVGQNGKVTGVKAGTVNVVVTTKGSSKTATCAVTVKANPADKPEEPAE